jgi:Putative Ig domain
MPWKITKLIVFVYLISSAAVSIYALYGLWRLDPAALVESVGRGAFPDTDKLKGGPPKIQNVDPARLAVGGMQSTLKVYGYNFDAASTVRLNGVARTPQFVDEHELVVLLTPSDTTSPAILSATVVRPKAAQNTPTDKGKGATEGKDASQGKAGAGADAPAPAAAPEVSSSNVVEVPIGQVYVKWIVFWTEATFSLEVRLMLLVLFAGAFAASIYGIKSFVDYAGEETLTASWCWLYFSRPILGSGLAFIFYLVIRAGFLASTGADAKAINPFGFVAVAALVGMFSDKAILKLGDVFNALFQPADTRSNKLQGLSIALSALPNAAAGAKYGPHQLAKGGTPPYKWTVNPALPGGLNLGGDGVLTGTPTAPMAATMFAFKVTDAVGATDNTSLSLTVT